MIGMNTFGSSAPLKDVQTKFGFTPDKVAGGRPRRYSDDDAHAGAPRSGPESLLDNITRTMLDDGTEQATSTT